MLNPTSNPVLIGDQNTVTFLVLPFKIPLRGMLFLYFRVPRRICAPEHKHPPIASLYIYISQDLPQQNSCRKFAILLVYSFIFIESSRLPCCTQKHGNRFINGNGKCVIGNILRRDWIHMIWYRYGLLYMLRAISKI